MITLIYIIVFSLIAFVIIRIFVNSNGITYSPNDEENITQINLAKMNLKEKWNIEPGNYWIPQNGDISDNSCYFDTNEFNSHFGLDKLSVLINRIEKGKIYSFSGTTVFREINELNINASPRLDTYYLNSSGSWIVNITHSGTIAFGGYELISALKNEWSEFDEFKSPWDKYDTY